MIWIKELVEGERVTSIYLVNNVTKGVTGNNQPYLNLVLQDKTGTIDGKVWDASSQDFELFEIGKVIQITSDVNSYRNSLQLKIISAQEALHPITYNIADLVPSSPIPVEEMEKTLVEKMEKITDPDLHLLVKTLIEKYYPKFIAYPAAVRNHHEYAGGLLYHTLSMFKLAEAIVSVYPSLDENLLYSGILLHDLGKTVELSGPLLPKYTVEGKLLGHISLMTSEILKTGEQLNINQEKVTLLAHMILSHHGKYEFGSPVMPLTKEAIFLNMIDDMDAKATMVDKALEDIKEGEFTPRLFTLDDRSLYKPHKK